MMGSDPMPIDDGLARTVRGFRVYAELEVRGREVVVQESSIATERRCWIFGDPSLHLNEEQARVVRDALDAFLEGR